MKSLNQKGQILIFVALAFITLGLLAGLGVDLGRGFLLRARLSRVVDAAAIAGAKTLKGQVALQNEAILAACDAAEMNGFTCGRVNGGKFDLKIDFVPNPLPGNPNFQFIEITGTASIPTTLLRLLTFVSKGDFSTLNVTAFAQAGPQRPVDLMLVLDRSGSMLQQDGFGNTKISALKTTVTSFLGNSFSSEDQVGMVSFATRGCGSGGNDSNSTADPCPADISLSLADSSKISALKTAVNNLNVIATGFTNTMEALRSAGEQINTAFNTAGREQSRKAILLVTDGQPTALRRFGDLQCNQNPRTGDVLPPPTSSVGSPSFPNGCAFTLGGITSGGTGMHRYTLQGSLQATFSSSPLYQDVARSTRDMVVGAMIEADKIRDYKSPGSTSLMGEVVIYVIGIGTPNDDDPKARLDANAKCLLARMANANTIDNPGDTPDESLASVCNAVPAYKGKDSDLYSDLKQNWPCAAGPCINSNQQEGKVWTVDMSTPVAPQLQVIFDEIAALLKLRLTI